MASKAPGGGPGTKTTGKGKTAIRTTMTPVFGRGKRTAKRSGGRSR